MNQKTLPTRLPIRSMISYFLWFLGKKGVFESCDTICKTMDHAADADLLYPPEFLHKVDPPNFPHHKIALKVGVPIMFYEI